VPQDDPPLGERLIQDLQFQSVPLVDIPGESINLFFGSIRQMGEGLLSLIRGETPLDDLAGPIGMGQLTSEVINESPMPLWITIANLMFILSLNLGLLNLLPLPALDGGRLLFVLIEVLRGGRRVSPEKEGMVHFFGMVLLLTVMLGIAFLDVERLLSGGSFLE
jgi:regulator of sigma E protease